MILRKIIGSAKCHWMIHRHPGLLSLPSRSLPADFIFASSSSTISCGLIVMWIMCGVAPFLKPASSCSVSKYLFHLRVWALLPANRVLSLSIFPIEIKRIDSGLEGFASHSLWVDSTLAKLLTAYPDLFDRMDNQLSHLLANLSVSIPSTYISLGLLDCCPPQPHYAS